MSRLHCCPQCMPTVAQWTFYFYNNVWCTMPPPPPENILFDYKYTPWPHMGPDATRQNRQNPGSIPDLQIKLSLLVLLCQCLLF